MRNRVDALKVAANKDGSGFDGGRGEQLCSLSEMLETARNLAAAPDDWHASDAVERLARKLGIPVDLDDPPQAVASAVIRRLQQGAPKGDSHTSAAEGG